MNHIGTRELHTQRLVLRRFRAEDAESAFRNFGSDPAVSRYISFVPCRTRESTQAFLQMHLERYASDPDFYGWAVTLNGEVIGSAGLFNVDPAAESCELGYSLGSRWWNRGLITEAASALICFAFDDLGVHRVSASHHIDNIASGRVMQKCGMRREGILRDAQHNADGTFSDLVLYSILSADRPKY